MHQRHKLVRLRHMAINDPVQYLTASDAACSLHEQSRWWTDNVCNEFVESRNDV